jgi:hypothetical protein
VHYARSHELRLQQGVDAQGGRAPGQGSERAGELPAANGPRGGAPRRDDVERRDGEMQIALAPPDVWEQTEL